MSLAASIRWRRAWVSRGAGEVDPACRGVDGAMLSPGSDAGRECKAGDGEADELALIATEAADRVAH